MVEGGDRLLAREEPFAGDEVAAAFEAEGIDRRAPGARGRGVAPPGGPDGTGGGSARTTLADGRELGPTSCWSPWAAGPPPATLGLDTVGLEPGDPSRSTTGCGPIGVAGGWLYAVGDCNGRALLTHMGKYQARLAGDVILGQRRHATSPTTASSRGSPSPTPRSAPSA